MRAWLLAPRPALSRGAQLATQPAPRTLICTWQTHGRRSSFICTWQTHGRRSSSQLRASPALFPSTVQTASRGFQDEKRGDPRLTQPPNSGETGRGRELTLITIHSHGQPAGIESGPEQTPCPPHAKHHRYEFYSVHLSTGERHTRFHPAIFIQTHLWYQRHVINIYIPGNQAC